MGGNDDQKQLGPLLRLWGLTTAQLPDPSETPDNLAPFLISILQEAVPFIDSAAPKSPVPQNQSLAWKTKGTKSYPESDAPVYLSERVIPSSELARIAGRSSPPSVSLRHDARIPPETWVCRRSVHRDLQRKGTASWTEFRAAMKDQHAETEKDMTPTVIGARVALSWDCGIVEAVEGGETWGQFTLCVEEMRHRIGRPVLKDRIFPVLQMTCSSMDGNRTINGGRRTLVAGGMMGMQADEDNEGGGHDYSSDAAAVSRTEKPEFLIVNITVADFVSSAPQAQLSREKDVVVGAYVSVERIRKLPDSGDIEWVMATASDARGVLPLWLQSMAVPGQIAKDVPLFLSWIERQRQKETYQLSLTQAVKSDNPGLSPSGENARGNNST
ncbi:hypothetical protein VTK73DRAFT_1260 [Phialemonium thermophilum]|uniref:DUF3074 domain-containing protein n=1 Tax=Phialemonium thermophilum TaxID=223376 RepID=A0ABR3Y476_9PEZI